MNLNKTKKDLNPEIKKEFEKSKLKVLTNENDFLVKNLKKAGWFIRAKIFLNNKIFKNSFLGRNNDFLNDYSKYFYFVKYKISIKYTSEYSRYQTHKSNPSYIIQISIRDQIRNINGKFPVFLII